jgi:hypothetical protein
MDKQQTQLAEAVELLRNPKALKRESGAKRLRKLGLSEAGDAVFEALQQELKDKRTWSAKYHLIVTLGVLKHLPALPLLWELAAQEMEATILYLALGDALMRLLLSDSVTPAEAWAAILRTQRPMLFDGALRAITLLKLVPDTETIRSILAVAEKPEFVEQVHGYPGDPSGIRYWAAVASAGWPQDLTREFLASCQYINHVGLRHAVELVQKRKYVKWDY